MTLMSFGVVASVFAAGKSVALGPDAIKFMRNNLSGRALESTFETHMLQKMRNTIILFIFVFRASLHQNHHCHVFSVFHRHCNHSHTIFENFSMEFHRKLEYGNKEKKSRKKNRPSNNIDLGGFQKV